MSSQLLLSEISDIWAKVESRGGDNRFVDDHTISSANMMDLAAEVVTRQSARRWCEDYSANPSYYGETPPLPVYIDDWDTDAAKFAQGMPLSRQPIDDMVGDLDKMLRYDADASLSFENGMLTARLFDSLTGWSTDVIPDESLSLWYTMATRFVQSSREILILQHGRKSDGDLRVSGDFKGGDTMTLVLKVSAKWYEGPDEGATSVVRTENCYFTRSVTATQDSEAFIGLNDVTSIVDDIKAQYAISEYTDISVGQRKDIVIRIDDIFALIAHVAPITQS